MTIALHISADTFAAFGANFNYDLAIHLALINPDDHYILIYDSDLSTTNNLPSNCTVVHSGPVIKNQLSKYYWYNYKLPSLIRKYDVQLLIPHPGSFCSNCTISQFYCIQEEQKKRSKKILAANTAKFIAASIAVLHTGTFKGVEYSGKKHVEIPFGLSPYFKPLDFEAKENVKKKYASEHEYFFTIINEGEQEYFRTLLRAFSHFKKWQKSALKLIVLVKVNPINDLHLYKFRDDVILIFEKELSLQEKGALMASAYANIVYTQVEAVASVKCHIPAIRISGNDNQNEATLYATPDEKDISKNIILIYKDEQLRNQLIEACRQLSLKYTWENSAAVADVLIDSIQ